MVACVYFGANFHASDVESRARVVGELDCYTNQDIEYIVFGTFQE